MAEYLKCHKFRINCPDYKKKQASIYERTVKLLVVIIYS